MKHTACIAFLFCLVESVSAAWYFNAWTGDADSGISSTETYTMAHSFGNLNGGSVTVNGVTFVEAASTSGTNDSGAGWSLTGAFALNADSTTDITGDSLKLANQFYSGGDPRTITLTGLTAGYTYQLDLFSVAWEDGSRIQTFSDPSSGDMEINQDHYGNNKGIRITSEYTATDTTHVFTITPVFTSTMHLYAMSNQVVSIPEPTIFGILGCSMLVFLLRRRRDV